MPWNLDPVHSSVEFGVRHMVITTVKGRFTSFEVDADFDDRQPESARVEAHIDTASIETKDGQRDTHLKSGDFLDSEQHPWIVFRSRSVEPNGTAGRYRLLGDLTIRDVTREVVLDVVVAGRAKDPWGNERAGFSAETNINRKDFGLAWNVALETGGWLVGENVKISLELQFVRQD